jgi:cobalamin synthase
VPTREDWQRRLGPLYGGAVALAHSTPVRWPELASDESRSPGWIVVLGAPIGVLAYIVAALSQAVGLPATVSSTMGIAMLSIASAALVERGLADRIDRWQTSGRSTAASVMTLVFLTLVRVEAFATLTPSRWLVVLVAMAMVGRWSAVFLQALGDPIIDDAAPRSLVANPAPAWLIVAISVAVLTVCVLAIGKGAVAAMAIAAAVAFVLGLDAQRRDRGLSGPVVAMAAAIGELLVLLVAAAT